MRGREPGLRGAVRSPPEAGTRDRSRPEETVRSYKSLSWIEQAFRSHKTVDLKVRPLHHRLEGRVRAHIFLCMLAYYVEWHIRQRLAPLLFEDDDRPAARAARHTPVEKARVSPGAKRKADTKRTPDGLVVHSFETLLDDLSSVALNKVCLPGQPGTSLAIVTQPTRIQARAFELLDVNPRQSVPISMTE